MFIFKLQVAIILSTLLFILFVKVIRSFYDRDVLFIIFISKMLKFTF